MTITEGEETTSPPAVRWGMLVAMAVFYVAAGAIHLARPDAFLPIVPNWVPEARAVVQVTGVCELTGAFGLLTRRWRWWAGVMLALYAVCVFPANIKHAMEGIDVPALPHSWWYHGPRLAAQPFIVWWALFCAGVTDWPFARGKRRGAATPGQPR